MHRDAILTTIVYPEMYRDTIFTIEICPDMYHDTVSLAVSSRFFCVPCFCVCTRASFVFVWSFEHTCLSRWFISRFIDESVQCRNESIGRHLVSRVVQRTLGKYAALSVGVDQVGNLVLSRVAGPGWKPGFLVLSTWCNLVV